MLLSNDWRQSRITRLTWDLNGQFYDFQIWFVSINAFYFESIEFVLNHFKNFSFKVLCPDKVIILEMLFTWEVIVSSSTTLHAKIETIDTNVQRFKYKYSYLSGENVQILQSGQSEIWSICDYDSDIFAA